MNKGLQQKLFDTYPKIFAEVDKSHTESLMCYGCTCEDGWYYIIDALCKALQDTTDLYEEPQIVAFQIKERFGTLRFYAIGGFTEKQGGMISFAEALSARVCEQCGSNRDVKLREGPWIRTLCEPCDNKRNRNLGEENG